MTTEELKSLLRECREIISDYTSSMQEDDCDNAMDVLENISAALSSDFAVVPKEPTKEMATAACDISDGYENLLGCNVIEIYQAMLAASEGK